MLWTECCLVFCLCLCLSFLSLSLLGRKLIWKDCHLLLIRRTEGWLIICLCFKLQCNFIVSSFPHHFKIMTSLLMVMIKHTIGVVFLTIYFSLTLVHYWRKGMPLIQGCKTLGMQSESLKIKVFEQRDEQKLNFLCEDARS